MNLVSELDLPAFDYAAPDFSADRFHAQLAGIRQHGWLATSPLVANVFIGCADSTRESVRNFASKASRAAMS